MSFRNYLSLLNPLWKIPVVIIAIITGAICANQAGWSGAELFLRLPWHGLESIERLVVSLLFGVGAAATYGSWYLVERIAKPALLVMAPILLYCALVIGAWDGYWSDFDAVRLQAMKHKWANGYALERMSEKGRELTCRDGANGQLELTVSATKVCEKPDWARLLPEYIPPSQADSTDKISPPDWDSLSTEPPKRATGLPEWIQQNGKPYRME